MAKWKIFAYLCIVLYTVSKNVVHADLCDSLTDANAISQILLKVYKGNSSAITFTSSTVTNAESLAKDINPDKDTVFYTHGYTDDADSNTTQMVIKAYLDRGNVNLIVGDWGNISKNHEYIYPSSNVPGIGRAYAQAINKLANVINFSTFHVIGHSLGAHIGGYIGRSLNGTLNRLTGLDPAFPLFYPSTCHINSSDADIVVALHTDAGIYGTPFNTASVDFWANKGTSPQPGCSLVPDFGNYCSHTGATAYYAESVRLRTALPAHKCNNGTSDGAQSDTQIYFGDAVPKDTRGEYCFTTSGESPYIV